MTTPKNQKTRAESHKQRVDLKRIKLNIRARFKKPARGTARAKRRVGLAAVFDAATIR